MRHAAQTAASKEFVTSSLLKINFNKSGVIGFFRVTRSPKWRLIPFKILFTQKLSLIGFGSPHSKCNKRIIFKYCFTELNCRERAKKVAYLQRVCDDAGTGVYPILPQKVRYECL